MFFNILGYYICLRIIYREHMYIHTFVYKIIWGGNDFISHSKSHKQCIFSQLTWQHCYYLTTRRDSNLDLLLVRRMRWPFRHAAMAFETIVWVWPSFYLKNRKIPKTAAFLSSAVLFYWLTYICMYALFNCKWEKYIKASAQFF